MSLKLVQRLIAILGQRAFWSFAVVTLLVAALLAAVNITSRHALKSYVEDQLERISWDLAMIQTTGFTLTSELSQRMSSVEGLEQVESLVLLRAKLPEGGEVVSEVDGKPLTTPWLSMLAATDPGLLPPKLNLALGNGQSGAEDGDSLQQGGAIMALVGPDRAMGSAFLALQGSQEFSIKVVRGDRSLTLFSIPLQGVIRLDRDELNRWLMDQLGSISFIPHVGIMLLMPYQEQVLERFDSVATGLVPLDLMGDMDTDFAHVQRAEYMPEVVYVGRLDQEKLISGWDIPHSLENLQAVIGQIHSQVMSVGVPVIVDSTTQVLLQRMSRIARVIGLLSLLIALPLLWMAWLFAGNLSGLLMLNERRKLGLMRLRGVPGQLIGRAFLLAILVGGLLGGALGLAIGSVFPLMVYEGGDWPTWVLTQPQQLLVFVAFLAITVGLALISSRRLIRYATTISPLEASGRVAGSEALKAGVKFGPLELLCFVIGFYTLGSWISGYSLSLLFDLGLFTRIDQLLAFVGLPLFLYGIVTLLVSRARWVQRLLGVIMRPVGGRLGTFSVKHLAVKPHRSFGFLLIVALVVSVSIYPTITSGSFENKGLRGARVQMGAQSLVTLNAPDLVDVEQLRGGLRVQLEALQPRVENILSEVRKLEGVQSVTYMLEAILPNFFLPNYGLRGVPIFLIYDVDAYLENVYSEPELGIGGTFEELVSRLKAGELLTSPPVADFWRLRSGSVLPVGMDEERRVVSARVAGSLAFLPGTPPRTVTDRQGFVEARVDYLNYLFSQNAYLVAVANSPELEEMVVLVPHVILLVNAKPGASLEQVQRDLVRLLPSPPIGLHDLPAEIRKVGSDMFIALALENMQIYLVGGLLLALIAILSVALVNYTEDRHTLALVRIRGTSPVQMWRFFVALLIAPGLLGLVLGGLVSLLAGYGLANRIWNLREIQTAVQLLPTRLVLSPLSGAIIVLVLIMLLGVACIFSWWVFRRTARETATER